MIIINPTDNRYLSQKPKLIHKTTRNEKCETDEFENKLRKEIERMADFKVLGANVPRANPKAIQSLIDAGILFVGKDNQLHVIDLNENIPTEPTKAKGKDIE